MAGSLDEDKRAAGEAAVAFIQPGMVVGLGSGSTASYALRHIAEKLASGELSDILGIPTSLAIEAEARRLGIPLTTLNDHPSIDVTIDGADEVDPNLDLIKGGGGALTREKIVALASQREIIVIDESKLSGQLGSHHRVPVEVLPFGWVTQKAYIASLGAGVSRRENPDGSPFETDQGQWILDCDFGPLGDPQGLAANLESRSGIVEHGLFLGLATDVIVAGPGGIRHLRRDQTGSLNGRNG